MSAVADAPRRVRMVKRVWARPAPPRPETVLAALVAAAVLVVHDLGNVFHQGYWLDEDWVAITTRYPLSDLARTTSSTPIGFSFALRLVPWGGPEALRVVPLLFSVATVLVAYVLAHRLPWADRLTSAAAGLSAAVAALLVPAMLERNDLKQYTADAMFSLLVLAATSRLERDRSRRNLALLLSSIVGGMLFSHPAAFLGIAAFVCLVGAQLLRRAWRAALETGIAGLAAAGGMALVYVAFDQRAVVKGLTRYWASFYVPTSRGPHVALVYLQHQWTANARYFGLGPIWVAAPLFIAGTVTIARLGRPATALTPTVLLVELTCLSALKKYPLLDLRTGTFLFVVVAVVAAVGVVGIAAEMRRWLWTQVPAVFLAACVALFALHSSGYARKKTVPQEPLRDQVRYLASHRAPSDVIVVSGPSASGFVVYWPQARPGIEKSEANLQRYLVVLPHDPDIVVARDVTDVAVAAALREGLALARTRPGARIWLVRSHVSADEAAAWTAVFRSDQVVGHATGASGLVLVEP